jgi:GTP-binding protein LepA
MSPAQRPVEVLSGGEVGYITGAIKSIADARVGDTITLAQHANDESVKPLPGYSEPVPMVYCGLYPTEGDDYPKLRDSIERLKTNDAALVFEPDVSSAMGFGFRCGFLGLLHMEIVQERLEREYDLDLIVTAPSVVYHVNTTRGEHIIVDTPSRMPEASLIESVSEPYVALEVLSPKDYSGTLMELCQTRRGEYKDLQFVTEERVSLKYDIPLSEVRRRAHCDCRLAPFGARASPAASASQLGARACPSPPCALLPPTPLPSQVITDFFDEVKSRTKGYASLEYKPIGYRVNKLVKLEILINSELAPPLSVIVHQDNAHSMGKRLTRALKELIPRQQFKVPIQAAVGAKVVASSTINALRKDVLAKCYGGDISRKKKLLNKQAKGKKRMKTMGRVNVPQEAFMAVLNLNVGEDD